jgi:hypothetical protein
MSDQEDSLLLSIYKLNVKIITTLDNVYRGMSHASTFRYLTSAIRFLQDKIGFKAFPTVLYI